MTKRITEITVETERLLVAERHTTTRVWCVSCGREVWTAAAGSEEKFSNGTARSAGPQQAGADAVRKEQNRAEE
ncbi:MAG TPA: hypothetical protein VN256_26490 [Pyrinomonadaceae bacterium]|nr:hypothetical protein [Pyrinomonadaceae bacterium]